MRDSVRHPGRLLLHWSFVGIHTDSDELLINSQLLIDT